jgi:hypothetical protein
MFHRRLTLLDVVHHLFCVFYAQSLNITFFIDIIEELAYIYGDKVKSSTVLNLENPQKILRALSAGPMTKWELKEKTGMEYPRVHEAVALLERDGRVKVFDKLTSKKGREMKVYGLTFKGVVAYLASLELQRPQQIYPLGPGETVESVKEKYAAEKEAYQKQLEEIVVFLERYGRLLNYPLFKEIRWLMERWRFVVEDILEIAKFIEFYKPFPKGFMQLIKNMRRSLAKLKSDKWEMLRNPQMREPVIIEIMEGKLVKKEQIDPLKDIEEEIQRKERELAVLLQKEEEWWKRSFTAQFAERYESYKPTKDKDMRSKALHELFKKTAEEIRQLEIKPLEKMAMLFKGSAA